MKLIVAIISLEDVASVVKNLIRNGFFATKLSSAGGFLKEGNMTILVGVDEAKLDEVLAILDKYSRSRVKQVHTPSLDGIDSPPTDVTVGGATVFVLDCEQFLRL